MKKAVIILSVLTLLSCDGKIKKAEKDRVEQSAICDTIPYVTEQPEITLIDFYDEEIDSIRFQILRNGQLINDTLFRTEFTYEDGAYKTMKIPYDYFLKTDTIVVITQGGLYYYISDYHHYAYLHYGMFGYLGSSDCRFSEQCVVNGREYNNRGTLIKHEGFNSTEKKNLKIYQYTPQFKEFEKNAIVKFDDAREIYIKHLSDYSVPFLFCENGYYIFEEKLKGEPKLYGINAQTGEFKKLNNYPYEKEYHNEKSSNHVKRNRLVGL
ncbi:MAG: hypothetical protein LBU51_04910 [Bacteroidales bacterium]|nr:hypothetical protein [Bacteroidales bacterium]